jgi:SAM-dependent methyltransferase
VTGNAVRLNLGCGRLTMDGFLNVDFRISPGIDVVTDLTNHPWPWDDDTFIEVRAWHFLEHLPGYELDRAMHEIHRVLAPGGTLYAKVPYKEAGPYNPFHFHVFDRDSFGVWIAKDDGRDDSSLQHQDIAFRRARQEVVSLSGFPVWHIIHHFPRSEGILFTRDERGPFSRIPSRIRELREWLVKVG